MAEIILSERIDDVDWAALKAALAADQFDNGRTPEEYRRSHENSHAVAFGRCDGEYVANGRILSDGVCNAYLVDVWTASAHRRRGIGREVVERLVATVPGQHVAIFTPDMQKFYSTLGFEPEETGMSRVVGTWLGRST
ncbi:MAG TPA: GNAT family N-acetyltransferase [Mycobacteriales bacterium]